MANYNKVLLMGNLTRDPELRYTPGGSAVCEIGMAVNRQWKNPQSGEMQEETTFVDVTVWGRQGETLNQYMSKGRPIFIEGRLQLDSWETQDGQKRSKLKVVGERFQFIGGRGDGESGGGGGGGGGQMEGGGGRQAQPPRQQQQQQRPPAPRPQEPSVQEGPPDDDLNLDDIPF
jgi:single-strand DNA-binding protein